MAETTTPEHLYHVLLTTSHIGKNPNNVVEKVRIPGTYTSLLAAKAAAHSCLYEAGYERDWFEHYETKHSLLEKQNGTPHLVVYATAPDGTAFRVRIDTTLNDKNLTSDLADGRVGVPLYYVVQAAVEYTGDEGGVVRDITVQGTFESYEEARGLASAVLLSQQDGVTRESFAEYTEAEPGERDCGYGDNVIVHAASDYGTNYLVSVIKTQELEAVKIAEAAMKIG
ncbi:hypothetical protein ASPVEDRAFT_526573 [Aspergillus versicolor CBS 583.65]|uniref:Uncharacterized protein n=1 Tax=Aspergillus versicolor CBS 583.65 TaxID=1036611 RepID=A0A1L9PE38_ASPVE|nr:uncharacterized protein ASPVEDRAFT_526573 [Aspergillus versicolor CBS 583.65]OJI99796.1 hypothetical protein ASPVEDRAFT_526573 [Aspergillus versicolor CBS 583.65]